jgi:hypothetical protein
MFRWNRNEPVAAKRRLQIFVYDLDGAPAPATTLFTGTNELLVDKGDGALVAPGGVLSNTTRPLTFSALVISAVDTVNNRVTSALPGRSTGDGPVQITVSGGGTAPGGLAVTTDYYLIKYDTGQVQFATSLANALAGTAIDITSAGSGTISIVAVGTTKALNDGLWMYEASQAEINYRGTYFGLRISKPASCKDSCVSVALDEESALIRGTLASATASTAVLDSAGSATNDFHTNGTLWIVGGTGAGQFRSITAYVGGSKTCSIDRNWSVTPDATSQYVILPGQSAASSASVATAVWAATGEGAHTYGDLMRGLVSLNGGRVTSFLTGTLNFLSIDGAKTRWSMTCDQTGRLTITVGNLTP